MNFVALHSEPLCAWWWLAFLAAGVIAGVFGLTEKSKNMPKEKEKEKNLPQVATGGGGNEGNRGNGDNPFEELKRMMLETQQQLKETRQHLEKRIDDLAAQQQKMQEQMEGLTTKVERLEAIAIETKNLAQRNNTKLSVLAEKSTVLAVKNHLKKLGYKNPTLWANIQLRKPPSKRQLKKHGNIPVTIGEIDFMTILKENGKIKIIIGETKTSFNAKDFEEFLTKRRRNIIQVFNKLLGNNNGDNARWIELNESLARVLTMQIPKSFREQFVDYMEFWGVYLVPAAEEEVIAFKKLMKQRKELKDVVIRLFELEDETPSLREMAVDL